MLVCSLQAGLAEGRAGQARVVVPVAGGALPLCQHPADDALPGGGGDDVRHIQQLRWEDSIVNLELSSKPKLRKERISKIQNHDQTLASVV